MTEIDEDYIFRFKLDPDPLPEENMDPLIETVRSFLDEFLKIGALMYKGERVSVDGFTLLNDKSTVHELFPE